MKNWKINYWIFKLIYWICLPVLAILAIFVKETRYPINGNGVLVSTLKYKFLLNLFFYKNQNFANWLFAICQFETANFTSLLWREYHNPIGMGVPNSKDNATYILIVPTNVSEGKKSGYKSDFDGLFDLYLWLNIRMSKTMLPELIASSKNHDRGNGLIQLDFIEALKKYKFTSTPALTYAERSLVYFQKIEPLKPKINTIIIVSIIFDIFGSVIVVMLFRKAWKFFKRSKSKKVTL